MDLLDVNVLVYAARADTPNHAAYRGWINGLFASGRAFGVPDVVLFGFMRVVTNRAIFRTPSELDATIDFVSALRDQPNFVPVNPGPRQWDIFIRLCQEVGATGGLIQDAYLAALAIEAGDTWITADSDFRRFPGLHWRHPLSN